MPTLDELTERITTWRDRLPWAAENSGVVAATVAELALGEPVDVARIARRAGVRASAVLDLLGDSPAEFDEDGRLIGFGLTLRPTPHRLELDGRTLYAWCAPDTLEFPVLLGKSARIESVCFTSGRPIRIELDPAGVRALEPEEAVMSIVLADACMSDFRERLCNQQHFFSSPAAAAGWQAERPEALVVPVRTGFALARVMLANWFGEGAAADAFDRALAAIPSCALDEAGRREQRDRYARLAGNVQRLLHETASVEIEFGKDLDPELLEEALAVERECCPFFRFSFDRHERRLLVTVDEENMQPALEAIAHEFGAGRGEG